MSYQDHSAGSEQRLEQALCIVYQQQKLCKEWTDLHRRNLKRLFLAAQQLAPKLQVVMQQRQTITEALVQVDHTFSTHAVIGGTVDAQHQQVAALEERLSSDLLESLVTAAPAQQVVGAGSDPEKVGVVAGHTITAILASDCRQVFAQHVAKEALSGLLTFIHRWLRGYHEGVMLHRKFNGGGGGVPLAAGSSLQGSDNGMKALLFLDLVDVVYPDFASLSATRPRLRNLLVLIEDILESLPAQERENEEVDAQHQSLLQPFIQASIVPADASAQGGGATSAGVAPGAAPTTLSNVDRTRARIVVQYTPQQMTTLHSKVRAQSGI